MNSTNRTLLLALGMVCLVALAVLFVTQSEHGNQTTVQSANIAGQGDLAVSPVVGRRDLAEERNPSLLVYDLLSKELVQPVGDLSYKSSAGIGWTESFSSSEISKKLVDLIPQTGGLFSFLAPSLDEMEGVQWTSSLGEGNIWLDEKGDVCLALPFFPSVSIQVIGVEGNPLPKIPVDIFLLPHEEFQKAQGEAQVNSTIAKSAFPFQQIENILLGYQSITDTTFIRQVHHSDEGGKVAAVLPSAGEAVIIIPDINHRLFWQSISVAPGDNGVITCTLNPRPRAMGRVTYLDGSPAVGVRVSLATYLVPEEVDFSSSDRQSGAAMSGVHKADGTIHRVSRNSVITDHNGDYHSAMPFGIEYMTEVKTSDYYLSIIHPNGSLDIEGVLHQDFQIPSETDAAAVGGDVVSLEVVEPNGNALKDVSVGMAPYLDEPWFRMYPKTNTGSAGYVDLPWVSIGDSIVLTLKHKSWPGIKSQIVEVKGTLVTVKIDYERGTSSVPQGWQPGASTPR